MGLRYLRCYPNHLRLIREQVQQCADKAFLTHPSVSPFLHNTIALSAWDHDVCVAAFGAVGQEDGRGDCWALLSERSGRHMLTLTRHLRAGFRSLPFPSLTMSVRAGHTEGHRWAALLGFKPAAETVEAIHYERFRE